MGLEPGQTLAQAKAALHPKAGKGTWSTDADRVVYTANDGVPDRVVLETAGEKVVGVTLAFDDDALRAAHIGPPSFRFKLEKEQSPDKAAGPFHFDTSKVWATPKMLYTSVNAGHHYEVGRYDRVALGLSATGCGDVAPLLDKLEKGVHGPLGPDGLRPGPKLTREVDSLRLVAAAAELACPTRSGVLVTVADFFLATGHPNGARDRYRKALKIDADWPPRQPADAHGGLGRVAARYKRMDEAGDHFRLAIQASKDPAEKALWARRYADALHGAMMWGPAAKYYGIYLDAAGDTADPSDTARVYARLVRSSIEVPHGCAPAKAAVQKGVALTAAGPRAKAEMLAAKAFYLIACEPGHKKEAYAVLGRAVKLDPLKATEWAGLTAYYDREANDASVLEIMLENKWLDKRGIEAARAYQKYERTQVR